MYLPLEDRLTAALSGSITGSEGRGRVRCYIATGARFLNPGTGWFYSPVLRDLLTGDRCLLRHEIPACEGRPLWESWQNEAWGLKKGCALLGSSPSRGHSLLRGALPAVTTLLASLARGLLLPGGEQRTEVEELS